MNGAPFYVMGFVDGHIAPRRGRRPRRSRPSSARRAPATRSPTRWPRIHAVDPDAVGLGDLGRKRATSSASSSAGTASGSSRTTRELPDVDEVHDAPARPASPSRGRPPSSTATTGSTTAWSTTTATVIAVLDWEICTLGDPLADVGLLMVYWTEPGDEHTPLLAAPPPRSTGFPRARRAARRATPRRRAATCADVDFYIAFGYWKLACILEGVYARYVGGAMGADAQAGSRASAQVERCADRGGRDAGAARSTEAGA